MQSWVGMLQMLHHHNRTHQPGRAVSLETPPLRAAGEDGESAGLHQRWGVWLVGLSEVLEHIVCHHTSCTFTVPCIIWTSKCDKNNICCVFIKSCV